MCVNWTLYDCARAHISDLQTQRSQSHSWRNRFWRHCARNITLWDSQEHIHQATRLIFETWDTEALLYTTTNTSFILARNESALCWLWNWSHLQLWHSLPRHTSFHQSKWLDGRIRTRYTKFQSNGVVKSFGTEGRKGNPAEEIPAADQVFPYIVFKGTDIKDLYVISGPKAVDPAAVRNTRKRSLSGLVASVQRIASWHESLLCSASYGLSSTATAAVLATATADGLRTRHHGSSGGMRKNHAHLSSLMFPKNPSLNQTH